MRIPSIAELIFDHTFKEFDEDYDDAIDGIIQLCKKLNGIKVAHQYIFDDGSTIVIKTYDNGDRHCWVG